MDKICFSLSALSPCENDIDCNNKGACIDGTCSCNNGWEGSSDCSGMRIMINTTKTLLRSYNSVPLMQPPIVYPKYYKKYAQPLAHKISLFQPKQYRGSLPNATFGSGKKSHQPNFAVAKYLANTFFWPKYFITAIFSIFGYIIKMAVMKYLAPNIPDFF